MKKFFNLAMLFAASAAAFVSCSKDEITDEKPGSELSGKMKTITVNSAILTRTELDGHDLKWSEGDTYSIFFGTADGEFLEYAVSPEYVEGLDSYELSVPEEAQYLCCVYPATGSHASEKNLTAVKAHIPDFDNYGEQYEFDGTQHLMAAKAEIGEDNTVTVIFSPLVSILEFNIYDTKGVGSGYYFTQLRIDTDTNCSGDCTIDFTADTPTLNTSDGSAYVCAGYQAFVDELASIPDSKENGLKVYALIAQGEYGKFDVKIDLTEDESGAPDKSFMFEFGNVAFSKFGHTINIDLAKDPSLTESPTESLVTDLEVETLGPWLVSAKFNVSSDCVKYVVGGMPTQERDMGDGLFSNDGYDEEKFIEEAKDALTAGGDYSKWLAFDVADSSQEQTVTELYMRGGTYSEPNGLRLNNSRGEYTIAIYAVDDSGKGEVYTTTFTAPAFSMGSGSVTPSVASTKNQKNSAAATISADGAEYIFYGYSNTLSDTPTESQINAMYTSNEMDTFFVKYESPVTLEFQKWGTSKYIVWAVAVDAAGAVSSVASQTFEYQDDVVDTDGSATINSFEALHLWQVNDDDDSPIYELEAKFSLSDDAEKVAVFYLAESATKNADNPIKLTVDMVKNMLISEMGSANGLAYTKANAEKGIRLPIATIFEDAENKTGAKPETSYYMFAVATDANGAYGNFENLAWVGGFTIDQPGFLQTPYTIEKSVEKEEKGGGDVEKTNYWTQNLAGTYTDWLEVKGYMTWPEWTYRNWDADITWKQNADGYANVKGVYVSAISLGSGAFSADAVIAAVKENFANYDPANPDTSVSGDFTIGWGANAKRQFAPNPPQSWEGETAMVFTQKNSGGTVYVTTLVDNEGNLTMKTAAYLYGEEDGDVKVAAAEVKYVDLTELAK